jgi:dihydroxyacetone kinase
MRLGSEWAFTTNLEVGAITSGAIVQLTVSYNIEVVRVYARTYLANLNSNGFSISL